MMVLIILTVIIIGDDYQIRIHRRNHISQNYQCVSNCRSTDSYHFKSTMKGRYSRLPTFKSSFWPLDFGGMFIVWGNFLKVSHLNEFKQSLTFKTQGLFIHHVVKFLGIFGPLPIRGHFC